MLVPVALNQTYSYRVPRGMELKPGDVVCVPLGPREVVAVVWAENANPDPRLHNRLKDVGEKLDVPPLKEELRCLVDWVANYTLSARGMVLRMALRMGENLGPERMRLGVRLVGEPPRRLTPARRRLIDGAVGRPAARQVRRGAGSGRQRAAWSTAWSMRERLPSRRCRRRWRRRRPIRPLRSRTFRRSSVRPWMRCARSRPMAAFMSRCSTASPARARPKSISRRLRKSSGADKQTLILMPEIALTGQFLDRFAQRFGVRPLEWHSELTPRTRQRNWAAISARRGAGRGRRALGAVSALCGSGPDHRR